MPGKPFATPPEELKKLAGYWPDIEKSRAEFNLFGDSLRDALDPKLKTL